MVFREALAHSPDNVPLRRLLADSLLAQGLADEAEVEYRRALVLAPTDANLQLGLVRAFLRQEKSSAALALVEAMVKRPDGPDEVFVIHARLLAARGEISAAIAQYRLGIERDPAAADADFEARFGLGAHDHGGEVSGRARPRTRRGGTVWDRGRAAADPVRRRALLQLGDRDAAAATIEGALRRNPDDAATHTTQGWAMLHGGDPTRAAGHFREALRLDPTSGYARSGIVEALKARNPIYRQLLSYFL